MPQVVSLFVGTFATLLAIINPLTVLPIFVEMLEDKDQATNRAIAAKACLYATGLAFFFLLFGNLIMGLFNVPLSMVRVVGGIILTKIGFDLFNPPPVASSGAGRALDLHEAAFVPLAMPLLFGPGAIATILGMTSNIDSPSQAIPAFVAISAAILATMSVCYLFLANASKVLGKIGPMGIDAMTRILGFFLSAMGVGLIFNGTIQALQSHGLTQLH